jgi:hypothetical protein
LSREEATAEVVAALANRVSDRFASILLTPKPRQTVTDIDAEVKILIQQISARHLNLS